MFTIKRDSLLVKLEKINKIVEESTDIKEFLNKQKYQTFNEKRNLNWKNLSLTYIAIKVFWAIFASLYLFGVFENNDYSK